MSSHTPTTEQARARFAYRADHPDGSDPAWGDEFDRWLAAHDAEVRASVLAEQGEPEGRRDHLAVRAMIEELTTIPASVARTDRESDAVYDRLARDIVNLLNRTPGGAR